MENEVDRFIGCVVEIISDDNKQLFEKVKKHFEHSSS
jgi:hypothetical protein